MISLQICSLFAVCTFAEQSPWQGVSCDTHTGEPDAQCQYGLEFVWQDPSKKGDVNSLRKCCQKGLNNTWDDCKCLPCDITCDSTADAQKQAYDGMKKLGYSDQDSKAASETYMCAWNQHWDVTSVQESKYKCCQRVEGNHECQCPPKDDTKKCYSKWANPDLDNCDWGQVDGVWCCKNSAGICRDNETSEEGFTDWAGCWGSSEDDCGKKSSLTRRNNDKDQTSGCVYDVSPMQKYCGREVTLDEQCQDQRPYHFDNGCGLRAIADTEWNKSNAGLKFAGLQAIDQDSAYCGSWWIEHPATAKPALLV